MRKLAGFFHWKHRAGLQRVSSIIVGDRERRKEFPTDHFLFSGKWSAEPVCIPSCCPSSATWSVRAVLSLTMLSLMLPLHMGTTLSLLLELYSEMSWHPGSARVFGAGYFFILFLANSVTKISLILDRSLICKTVMFHGFQVLKVFLLPFIPFQLFLCFHSGPSFLCPVSCYSFSFYSLCISFVLVLCPLQFVWFKPVCPEFRSPLFLPHFVKSEDHPLLPFEKR